MKGNTMNFIDPTCIDCSTRACRGKGGNSPSFCLSTHIDPELFAESLECLTGEDNAMAVAAAENEADGYCVRSRIEEVLHYAQIMGWRRIGIASCVGLMDEARAFAKVLRAHGYEVYGIACKCGTVKKTEIGAPERTMAIGPHICNPVLQAKELNLIGTELNVAIGLCVGHDSLFYKYSEAPVTTLVAKDRVTGHNPVAPLYLMNGYWKKLLEPDPYLEAPKPQQTSD